LRRRYFHVTTSTDGVASSQIELASLGGEAATKASRVDEIDYQWGVARLAASTPQYSPSALLDAGARSRKNERV
jgi:hypothetical protein